MCREQRCLSRRYENLKKGESAQKNIQKQRLKVQKLHHRMKNRHLSKAVASQKFYEFRTKLKVKCDDSGIELRIVDRFYPSSKLCHCCGSIKKDLKLSDRTYKCIVKYILSSSQPTMRIAIVDDLYTDRTVLKDRLERQLSLRGIEAEIWEFASGETFLAAEKKQHFTAAFLDIYMDGMSGMDAAKELRKKDADCLLIFTTTSTDHAIEGFQVRALHYLVKPFSETELSGLLDEMFAKLPRPEPVLTVKVSGSDVRLRYRDIVSAEHFAHMINIRTTAGKPLATRQSFKVFTEPLRKDPRFFVCGRGVIVNLEHAADFQDAAFCMTDGRHVYVSQDLQKAARQAFMEFLLQRGRIG